MVEVTIIGPEAITIAAKYCGIQILNNGRKIEKNEQPTDQDSGRQSNSE
jgi:hypothetical protein